MLEYMINATIKIQTIDSVAREGNKEIFYGGEGTGFFFLFQTTQGKVPAIVTTKHVIDKAITITFIFLEADGSGFPLYEQQQKVTINRKELLIIYHPETNVDLAIIPINPLLDYFQKRKINISYHAMDETVIPNDSIMQTLNPIEDLTMMAHPVGLNAELKGKPIVVKGITATPLFLNYDHQQEFLMSGSMYDGCSGAPVLLYQTNYSNRYDAPIISGRQRMFLVGINYATYTKWFREKVAPRTMHVIPGNPETSLPGNILYENIGVIIKSQRLLDFKKILNALKK